MSRIVNIHDAKTQLSQLINNALDGKEVIIARRGNPIIKLIPYIEELPAREGGQFKGLMNIAKDFDAALPEDLLKQFYK